MSVALVPILHHEVNWSTLLHVVKETTGLNVARAKDSPGVQELAAFLCAIEDLQPNKQPHIVKLREAAFTLKFLSFGFLVICPSAIDLVSSGLTIKSVDTLRSSHKLLIVTGDLLTWKNAIIGNGSSDYRQVMTLALNYFEQIGLSQVFANYKKRQNSDGTLRLEAK